MANYSSWFAGIISNLRDLGEKLEGCEAISKLLMSLPKEYDSFILCVEQFGHLKTMKVEEVLGHFKVHAIQLQERSSRKESKHFLLGLLIRPK